MLDQFLEDYDKWFVTPFCPAHKQLYAESVRERTTRIPPPCCAEVKKYSNRTPGLFKEEFKGSGMVALSSKTYFCMRVDNDLDSMFGEVPSANITAETEANIQLREKNRSKYGSKRLSKQTNRLMKE